jgi:hypothetical protein
MDAMPYWICSLRAGRLSALPSAAQKRSHGIKLSQKI